MEEEVNSSNTFLIIFGVFTFVFISGSLIFLNGITANVIGESRGNYYEIIFVFGILEVIVFLEILMLVTRKRKNKKTNKTISELIRESS
jgi:hypothetical protein